MVPDIVPAAKEYGLKSAKLGVQGTVGQRQEIMSGCTLSNGLPRRHLVILGMTYDGSVWATEPWNPGWSNCRQP